MGASSGEVVLGSMFTFYFIFRALLLLTKVVDWVGLDSWCLVGFFVFVVCLMFFVWLLFCFLFDWFGVSCFVFHQKGRGGARYFTCYLCRSLSNGLVLKYWKLIRIVCHI